MDVLAGIVIKEIIEQVLPLAVTAASGLVSLAVVYVLRYVNARVKNEQIRTALESLSAVTETVVGELAQTARDYSKGGISADEAERLKRLAYNRIIMHLPVESRKVLDAAIGSLGQYIERGIESKVLQTKAASAQVEMAKPVVVGGG